MEAQTIFRYPFTVCSSAHGSSAFFRLFMKKQMEVIRLQTDLMDLPIYAGK